MLTKDVGGGFATAIGSMPGTAVEESTRVVFGELDTLPHLVELPARGVGADLLGRAAAILVGLPVEVVPSGYRVSAKAGMDQRRASDLLRFDLDALHEVSAAAGARPAAVKVQVAGPWTLAAGIELMRGHRVLTDAGALREFTESLCEGITAHVAEVAARTAAPVIVQLDEPTLPAVLAGELRTPSGLATVAAVPAPDAQALLATVIEAATAASANPVVVHCCAETPPVALLRGAGAGALAVDLRALRLDAALTDEFGEALESGVSLLAGLVPATEPTERLSLREAASPALQLLDRLGFGRHTLAAQWVPTPVCGLAGAGAGWARQALALSADLAKSFVDLPESW